MPLNEKTGLLENTAVLKTPALSETVSFLLSLRNGLSQIQVKTVDSLIAGLEKLDSPLLTLNIEEAKIVREMFKIVEICAEEQGLSISDMADAESLLLDKLDMFLK